MAEYRFPADYYDAAIVAYGAACDALATAQRRAGELHYEVAAAEMTGANPQRLLDQFMDATNAVRILSGQVASLDRRAEAAFQRKSSQRPMAPLTSVQREAKRVAESLRGAARRAERHIPIGAK